MSTHRRAHHGIGRRPALVAAALALAVTVSVTAVAGTGVTGGRTTWTSLLSPERCALRSQAAQVSLQLEQVSGAATIVGVGREAGLPPRAMIIALATAIQESDLRNLDHGDRDSLGLFQQRPSQGWGTPEQIRDPRYAAHRFYEALLDIPGYADLPLTEAAQQVQRSAAGDAYAKHEPTATTIVHALTGPAGVTCTLLAEQRAVAVAPLQCRPTGQAAERRGWGAIVVPCAIAVV